MGLVLPILAMSSDSELTDISEEYEDRTGAGSNKRRRTQHPEYRITNALQTPNTATVCHLSTTLARLTYGCAVRHWLVGRFVLNLVQLLDVILIVWLGLMDEGDIKLDPEYQRDVV